MKFLKEAENKRLGFADVSYFDRTKNLENLWLADTVISDELIKAVKAANLAIKNAYDIWYAEIEKPRQEAKRKAEEERLDKSALKIPLTREQADLIDAVLGQLSDGYWENSKAAEKYWKNIDLRGDTLIVDLEKLKYASWSDAWNKEFNEIWQNPKAIKNWFARKAQIVHNLDKRDQFNTLNLDDEQLNSQAEYLDRNVNKTYKQIQDAIDSLKS